MNLLLKYNDGCDSSYEGERNTGENEVEKAEEIACLIKGLHTSQRT